LIQECSGAEIDYAAPANPSFSRTDSFYQLSLEIDVGLDVNWFSPIRVLFFHLDGYN
jgi:hypothetical protein